MIAYSVTNIERGTAGMLEWRSRDIGYGVEEDYGEYVARGLFDTWGKHEFEPIGGGETVYLFPDEVLSWERT